jgi:hypothetical protein
MPRLCCLVSGRCHQWRGYHMGVYLTGVYLMGVYLMGAYLTGVHLTGVHHKMQPFYLSRTQ